MDALWMFGALCFMGSLYIENQELKEAGRVAVKHSGISNSLMMIGCLCFIISMVLTLTGI